VISKAKMIDFHNHHIPARFELTATRTQPATQRSRWEMLTRKLPDEDLLLSDIREGHLAARVVNIPGNLIADADGHVPHDTIMAMNDELAELVARHPGRIYGLASVDGYDGDNSAREAERAITELGLRGLFVDCARDDLLIDAPQARPTLEVAAKLGVPVFAHPVAPEPLTKQMTPYGLIGTLFARGTVNGASLIALVEGGVFSQLPGLARGRDRTCRRRSGDGCGPIAPEQVPLRYHRGDAQARLHRHDADPSRSDPRLRRFAGGKQCACR
jgi:predicted TIM-barrel fold metal-dependent hydrolase